MIQVIRAAERHFTNFGWLQTYWLFSFSEYYDPANIQCGALRVLSIHLKRDTLWYQPLNAIG